VVVFLLGGGDAMSARKVRRDSTQKALRDAAVSMFAEFGYHAVTLRNLADRIGIQAGSLYNHIENKQQLLFEILQEIMIDLITGCETALASAHSPAERLEAFIDNHITFHTSRQSEVFIGNMELRNLSPENFAKMVALRDQYQRHLSDILLEGKEHGAFELREVRMTTFAVFGMLNGVSNWFNPAGPQTSAQVAEHYRDLVLRIVAPQPD
jgi:AcrR family transcriptional regulator